VTLRQSLPDADARVVQTSGVTLAPLGVAENDDRKIAVIVIVAIRNRSTPKA
jgi:hypothetical protein